MRSMMMKHDSVERVHEQRMEHRVDRGRLPLAGAADQVEVGPEGFCRDPDRPSVRAVLPQEDRLHGRISSMSCEVRSA